MSEIDSLNGSSGADGVTQVGANGVDDAPVLTGTSSAGPQTSGEANLTISTVEGEETVSSPSAQSVEAASNEGVQATAEDDESTDETGEDEVNEGDVDIALSASSVLADALLTAAEASSLGLEPAQAVLNRFRKADDGGDSGNFDVSGVANGRPGSDFDLETLRWDSPVDGLTESFAAAMARYNADPTAGGQSTSLDGLLGYKLIKA